MLPKTPVNATHWNTRNLAKAQGLSETSIRRIWKLHNLKPHLIESLKLSGDRFFTVLVGVTATSPIIYPSSIRCSTPNISGCHETAICILAFKHRGLPMVANARTSA